MNFLRPEFLYALPLVAVPLIVHLLNRQRYQRVEFAAMEFLRRALRKRRRRLLLEDLILLLLRTGAVLLLILGLAHPGAQAGSLFASRPARGQVLLLDSSLSMAYRSGGSSSFERALTAGLDALADLDPERGDRAALILASHRAERPAFGDPTEVRAALLEQERPGLGRADLAQALAMARSSAASLAAEGCAAVQVAILSDFQASAWDLEEAEGEALRALARDGFEIRAVPVGDAEPNNLAVTWSEVTPAEVAPGEHCEFSARLRHYGQRPRSSVQATLLLDGVPLTTANIDLQAGSEVSWSHALAPAEIGVRGLELRIDHDGLAGDDQRALTLAVRAPTQLLLVGEAAPARQPEGVFDVLRRFLDLGEGAPFVTASSALSSAPAQRLEEADVVILADPPEIPGTWRDGLELHLARGGGLLVALGPDFGAGGNAVLAQLGAAELTVGETASSEVGLRLAITDPQHPALQLFADPRWQPLLTEVPFTSYRPLALAGPGAASDQYFRVPLRYAGSTGEDPPVDHGPALVEWRAGAGRGAVLSAAPLPRWNHMSEVPGGTLPLLFDLLTHLCPRPQHSRLVEVGAALEVELPRPPIEVQVSDPNGRVFRPVAAASALPGGRSWQPLLDHAAVPGLWAVHSRLLERDGQERELVEKLAVVCPAVESDLAPVAWERLEALLPPGSLAAGATAEGALGEGAAPPAPADLSGWFYALVAAFLLLETGLSALLDRRRG